MIEDPRKQQMKALKGEMVRNIIISLLIAVGNLPPAGKLLRRYLRRLERTAAVGRSEGKADCFCAGDL